jgi:hypothetical protein
MLFLFDIRAAQKFIAQSASHPKPGCGALALRCDSVSESRPQYGNPSIAQRDMDAEPPKTKTAFINRNWLSVIHRMQQGRNDGCDFAIVNLHTFEVGIIIAMEKAGS